MLVGDSSSSGRVVYRVFPVSFVASGWVYWLQTVGLGNAMGIVLAKGSGALVGGGEGTGGAQFDWLLPAED